MSRIAAVLFASLCACVISNVPLRALAQSGPSQAKTVTLHFTNGLKFDLPAGWRFSELSGRSAKLHYGRDNKAFAKENRNAFVLHVIENRDDKVGSDYDRHDRQGNRTLANRTKVEWYAGPRWRGKHYVFSAQIENDFRYMGVTVLDRPKPAFSPELLEQAVLAVARSVRRTDYHRTFYHPAGMQAALPNAQWFSQGSEGAIRYACFQTYCGKDSNTWIFAYRSGNQFKSDDEALKDITGHYEKQEKLKIGAAQRMALADGAFLWTEQPGTSRPMLGIIRRAGKYFFVSAADVGSRLAGSDAIRPHFLALATSLQPWDGK